MVHRSSRKKKNVSPIDSNKWIGTETIETLQVP